MPDQWFYAHDAERLGPYSSAELLALATAGKIKPADTVWKAGIDQGVPAARVKKLFPAASVDAAPAAIVETPPAPPPAPEPRTRPKSDEMPLPPAIPGPHGRSELLGIAPSQPDSAADMPKRPAKKKGRATAGRGAVIVSQDGTTVQYIKKCIQCGHADASKSRMPIKQGTTRVGFYCPKCRKLRPVEIHGIL
jgi:hypothetical protein